MIRYRITYDLAGRERMIHVGRWQIVQEVYKGAQLVWTAIRSCFGAGFWVDEKPWLDEEAWKD